MKAKFTISRDPRLDALAKAAMQDSFYVGLFASVLETTLGVKTPFARPAAYYAQEPDRSVVLKPDALAVVFQLTGIRRPTGTA